MREDRAFTSVGLFAYERGTGLATTMGGLYRGRAYLSRKLRRTLTGVMALVFAHVVITAPPALALTPGNCTYTRPYQIAGHVWVGRLAHGMQAHFQASTPRVDDIHNMFSVSHVYMYRNTFDPSDGNYVNGNVWVETGFYTGKGGGSARIDDSVPHYFRTFQDSTGYHEGDDPSKPAIGSQNNYQLLFVGYDSGRGAYGWQMIYPVSTAQDTVYVKDAPSANPLVGGEAQGNEIASTLVQLSYRTVPSVRIYKIDNTWATWTPPYFPTTQACATAGSVTLTLWTEFTDFTANGSI